MKHIFVEGDKDLFRSNYNFFFFEKGFSLIFLDDVYYNYFLQFITVLFI